MNSAFLLVTAAFLAGADPVPGKIVPVSGFAGAHASSNCDCNNGCDADRPGLFDRLRGMFQRDSCDCDNSCDRPGLFDRMRAHFNQGNCDSKDCHDDCRPSFFDRLKARFQRDDCCDPCAKTAAASNCCNGHAAAPTTIAPVPATPAKVEPIQAPKGAEPKKMPDAPAKQVRLVPQSTTIPTGNLVIE